jgi:hypothetical protein
MPGVLAGGLPWHPRADAAMAASTPRFDLTAPSSLLLKNKPLTGTRVQQSYAFDNVHQRIYVVQLLPGADSTGDLYLSQLDWTGKLLGHMTLKGFGHGVSIGLELYGSTPYLWTEVDDDPANGRGRHIARFAYTAGVTRTNTSTALQKFDLVPGAGIETVSIDQTYKRIILRYFLSGHAHYAMYDLTTFENTHVFTKVHPDVAEPSWMGSPDFQGYTSYGDYLYMMQGTAYGTGNPRSGNGNTSITSVDLSTGQVVQRQVRSQAGYSLYYREPEGMAIQIVGGAPRLCLGFASTSTATSTTRLFTVYYKNALV